MEPFYNTYKPAWRSFYKLLFIAVLILILAGAVQHYSAGASWLKFMWIAALVIDLLIICYIAVQRATMSLILKDNPDKAEDQEVSFVVCHPLKPFSSDFRESVEIGLANIVHIKVGQTMMQTIMNIGDVIITSSGTGTEEIYAHNIPSPLKVRDEIQLHARRCSNPSAASSTPSVSPEAQQAQ